MRRLALLPVVVLLAAGCGWSSLLLGGSVSSTAPEALASEIKQRVPAWIKDEQLPPNAIPGANLFAVAGCTVCHTYDGDGGAQLGAPELTAEGLRNPDVGFQVRHLKCPSCVHPGSPMPKFASLGQERLMQLAQFLVASKGTH